MNYEFSRLTAINFLGLNRFCLPIRVTNVGKVKSRHAHQ